MYLYNYYYCFNLHHNNKFEFSVHYFSNTVKIRLYEHVICGIQEIKKNQF